MAETALSTDETHLQITFQAPDAVRQSLAELGRTEDIRFSPSGRRLAFACHRRGVIAVADVQIAGGPEVVITRLAAYPSPHLRQPTGSTSSTRIRSLLPTAAEGSPRSVCRLREPTGS